MTEEKKKQEQRDEIELTHIATSTAPAFKLPDGSIVGMEDYLVWLGNLIYRMKKAVA